MILTDELTEELRSILSDKEEYDYLCKSVYESFMRRNRAVSQIALERLVINYLKVKIMIRDLLDIQQVKNGNK